MATIKYTINKQEISVELRNDADQSVAAEIFKLREYRIAEKTIASLKLPILDVGAHAGFFSLYARALNSKVEIIALEPEPKNIQAFEDNIKNNKIKNITLVKGALAKKYETRILSVSSDSHNHKLSQGEVGHTITVQGYDVESLKKIFPNGVGLMKMDIEGGEYEIFENLRPEEFLQIRAIVMEYHDLPGKKHQALDQILRENGFGVQTFPSKFDKTMGFLWATNKRQG